MEKTTGRPKMPDAEKKARGARVRTLRERLRLTQEECAERASAGMGRTEWVKIEGGQNNLTSAEKRAEVANGLGVPVDQFVEYFEGRLEIDALMLRRFTEIDQRYPAGMAAVRGLVSGANMWEHLPSFEVKLDADNPDPTEIVQQFLAHVARRRGKSAPERGDPLADMGRPSKKPRRR